MRPNATEFQWSRRSETAALLVAKDEQPDHAIAAACKVNKATLERWKLHPEFAARVQEHRDTWRAEIKAKGIAERQNRVDAQNDRHRRMQIVLDARAQEHADVPGGKSGLLVRQVKLVKVYEPPKPPKGQEPPAESDESDGDEVLFSAKRYVEVDEYAVDTGLLKEFRELEKLTAQETGDWTEKRTVTMLTAEAKKMAEQLAAELGIPVEQVIREAGLDGGES